MLDVSLLQGVREIDMQEESFKLNRKCTKEVKNHREAVSSKSWRLPSAERYSTTANNSLDLQKQCLASDPKST
jgi:hypothetical protein